jgi:hypothetical protein
MRETLKGGPTVLVTALGSVPGKMVPRVHWMRHFSLKRTSPSPSGPAGGSPLPSLSQVPPAPCAPPFREHSAPFREQFGTFQGTFGTIQGTFGTIQGTYVTIQFELRLKPVSPNPNCKKHLKKVPRLMQNTTCPHEYLRRGLTRPNDVSQK